MPARPAAKAAWSILWLFLVFLLLPVESESANLVLSAPLEQGTAVLLRMTDVPAGSRLRGQLEGVDFPFSTANVALIALDMERVSQKVTLHVQIDPPQGESVHLTESYTILPRQYQEEHITLPEKKVHLDPRDQKRANTETAAIQATYQRRGSKAGYIGGFRQPVDGRFSGVFGSRRILNGVARNPHNGVDIAASKGTPVVATAAGEVALVGRDYFYTGNTVVLEHGDGVISLYAHLDGVAVQEGAWVEGGTTIGTVGMSGRATGPHLHWGMLVRQARVDPMRLPGMVSGH